jgi:predicted NUDIX family NTP pyrophosphohydrolase
MKTSAGIIVYRKNHENVELLLAHPGGPFYKNKVGRVWSIIKGETKENEDIKETAIREFEEETGLKVDFNPKYLGAYKSKKKTIQAFYIEKDIDETICHSNTCEIEFPPKSRQMITIPENDKYEWFNIEMAKDIIFENQIEMLDAFINKVIYNKEP